MHDAPHLASIDISPLLGDDPSRRAATAEAMGAAARRHGFFYVTGHGVDAEVIARMDAEARVFFALPRAEKEEVAMPRGGPAWRGWFPLGGELTLGRPDQKEGIYFGEELDPSDPRVVDRWPMHGANLWPARPAALRPAVETYVAQTARAAAAMMEGLSRALGLSDRFFADAYLRRPTVLFRIFRYPPAAPGGWGVGEHTDYGLLTLLAQDDVGGLQVQTDAGWIEAPPIPGTLVCNVGDMFERLSGGRYISAPHRVINRGGRERLSFPVFYDPDFEAVMTPAVALVGRGDRRGGRWDGVDPNLFAGRYRDYLLRKVGAVFPGLNADVGA